MLMVTWYPCGENAEKNSGSSDSRSIASPMSLLCVITTIRRPWLSAMPRKFTVGLSLPRSEVPPPLARQKLMPGTCGTCETSKSVDRTG